MNAQRRNFLLMFIPCAALFFALGWFLRGALYQDMILVEKEKTTVSSSPAERSAVEISSPPPTLKQPDKTGALSQKIVPEDAVEHEASDLEEASERIDLNSASDAELQTIPGIGEVLARRIIDYREANDGFRTVEELMDIKGIGEKTFAKIVDYVEVR